MPDDIAACAEIVRRADPERFRAVMAAPVAARERLFPIYAFNVEVARAPWVTAEPLIAEMRLQWWRDALAEIAAGGPVRRHEVATPLAQAIRAGDVVLLDALVEARRWDIHRDPFADMQAFRAHIAATSGNLLLVAALRTAGINADPVILSTRDHGRIHPVYPMIDKFNYVIAHAVVDNKGVVLDATDKYLGFGQLPERCLNFKGRLISPSQSRWIELSSLGESVSMITAELDITPQGQLKGKMNISSTGYDALNRRKQIIDNQEEFLKKLKDKNQHWEIIDHQFQNLKNLNEKMVCEYELELTDMAQNAGDVIFINPLLSEGLDENPFKQETRKYPVDMVYPRSFIIHMTLNLPEGYEVDEMPEPARILLPDNGGAFSYNITKLGDKLQVMSNYSLKKAFFMPEDYRGLKEFHDIVVTKCAEQVVLKKKQL